MHYVIKYDCDGYPNKTKATSYRTHICLKKESDCSHLGYNLRAFKSKFWGMNSDSPIPTDEEEIVNRFREGDPAAIEDLMAVHGEKLHRYLNNNRPTAVQADDIAQEVWMKVLKARVTYIDVNFKGWLYVIARSVLAQVHRKQRPGPFPQNYDPAAAENDTEDPRLAALRDCLEQLPGDWLAVIRGQMAGLDTRELSELLGVKMGTVGSRASRAKQSLKQCVEQKML